MGIYNGPLCKSNVTDNKKQKKNLIKDFKTEKTLFLPSLVVSN